MVPKEGPPCDCCRFMNCPVSTALNKRSALKSNLHERLKEIQYCNTVKKYIKSSRPLQRTTYLPRQPLIWIGLLNCRINRQPNKRKHYGIRTWDGTDSMKKWRICTQGIKMYSRHLYWRIIRISSPKYELVMDCKKSATVHDLAHHAISLTKL